MVTLNRELPSSPGDGGCDGTSMGTSCPGNDDRRCARDQRNRVRLLRPRPQERSRTATERVTRARIRDGARDGASPAAASCPLVIRNHASSVGWRRSAPHRERIAAVHSSAGEGDSRQGFSLLRGDCCKNERRRTVIETVIVRFRREPLCPTHARHAIRTRGRPLFGREGELGRSGSTRSHKASGSSAAVQETL